MAEIDGPKWHVPLYQVTDRVRVTEGMFAGWEGMIIESEKPDLITVEIDVYGIPTPVLLQQSQIEFAERNSN